jgi:hypothetical protein
MRRIILSSVYLFIQKEKRKRTTVFLVIQIEMLMRCILLASVYLFIQHEMRMRRIILSSVYLVIQHEKRMRCIILSSVHLVIQHEKRMHRIILSSLAYPAVPYFFPHFLVNGKIFGIMEQKKCVQIFSRTLTYFSF